MDKKEFLELVNFFNRLEVEEEEITTEEQRTDGQLVVIATYKFEGKTYRTNSLYYQSIEKLDNIKNKNDIIKYFNQTVYWLDLDVHSWPQGSGESDLEAIVINDMTDDDDFKQFLKKLANNSTTGYIQRITNEGRPAQYYHNLENNNHWHDLIKLIQTYIKSGGNLVVENSLFLRLVFKWDGNHETKRERSTLRYGSKGDYRQLVKDLMKNIKSIQGNMEHHNIINLLEYKKQIILQGPPGTGKTFTAKDIAFQIVFDKPIDETNRKDELKLLEDSEQFELIQFHPAYTYEDFVRGIVVESAGGSNAPTYTTKNKILAEMAQKALENKQNSEKDIELIKSEANFETLFDDFVASIEEELEKNDKVTINKTAYITEVEEMQFRYTGDNWNTAKDSIMKFDDIKNIHNSGITQRREVKKLTNISGSSKQNTTYFWQMVLRFRKFIEGKEAQPTIEQEKIPLKKYVLIIDEINRANLPAVLGELIYALEYRNEAVESMYDIDGNREITLPDNLYIIGTMNTADRSVGHIDYAIRRRFAFVDVLPSSDVIDSVISDNDLKSKSKTLFEKVASLFTSDYLASDFEAKDVQLGHSYFLAKSEDELKMKLEFEIKPILNEYVKDGILNNQAKEKIAALNV